MLDTDTTGLRGSKEPIRLIYGSADAAGSHRLSLSIPRVGAVRDRGLDVKQHIRLLIQDLRK
jgi:hypothetical protein